MAVNPKSEMGFKVPGFRQAPEIYPCPGGCGVMTRSNGQKAAKFPGTRCRGVGGMCGKCRRNAPTVAREAPPRPPVKPVPDRALLVQLMEAQARERRAREREQLELVMRRKSVQPAYSNA